MRNVLCYNLMALVTLPPDSQIWMARGVWRNPSQIVASHGRSGVPQFRCSIECPILTLTRYQALFQAYRYSEFEPARSL